jgi:ubiquinone/menaquinone biosynthesis C-methylase UbiE
MFMFIHPKEILAEIETTGYEQVVDIGVGSGAYTLLLASKLPHGHIYAVDIQKHVLTRLARHLHEIHVDNVTCIHANADIFHGIPLQDEIASMTILSNTIFQSEHPQIMLKEAARLTHPGGLLLLVDWKDSFSGVGPACEHIVSEKEAIKIAMQFGFSLDKEIRTEKHHWAILLRKNFTHE